MSMQKQLNKLTILQKQNMCCSADNRVDTGLSNTEFYSDSIDALLFDSFQDVSNHLTMHLLSELI